MTRLSGVQAAVRGGGKRARPGANITTRAATHAVTVAVLAGLTLGAADTSIAPAVANLYVGEQKVIEGPVTAGQREGNTVRLTLGTIPRNLTVSLVIGMLSHFPDEPERYYLGKVVRVTGLIRSFRGVPEVAIHDPADIEVVTGAAATAPRSAPPQAGPAAPLAASPLAAVPPAARTDDTPQQPEAGPGDRRTPSDDQSSTVERRLQKMGARIEALERRLRQLERAPKRVSRAHPGGPSKRKPLSPRPAAPQAVVPEPVAIEPAAPGPVAPAPAPPAPAAPAPAPPAPAPPAPAAPAPAPGAAAAEPASQ